MASRRKYTLRLIEPRKRPDTKYEGAFKLIGDVNVLDVEEYPLDPNPRKGDKIASNVAGDIREALLDPNSDFGQKSKGLIIAASSAEPGKRDGVITEYTVNMPTPAVAEDEDGRPVLSRYGVVDGRSNMKLIVELQKRIRQLNDKKDKGIDHTVPVEIRVGYRPSCWRICPAH